MTGATATTLLSARYTSSSTFPTPSTRSASSLSWPPPPPKLTSDQAMAYWIMAALTNDPWTLARYAGFYKALQSAGAAGSFGMDAVNTPFLNEILSSWLLMVFSIPLFVPPCLSRAHRVADIALKRWHRHLDHQGHQLRGRRDGPRRRHRRRRPVGLGDGKGRDQPVGESLRRERTRSAVCGFEVEGLFVKFAALLSSHPCPRGPTEAGRRWFSCMGRCVLRETHLK